MAHAPGRVYVIGGNDQSIFGAIISSANNNLAYFGRIQNNERDGYGIEYISGAILMGQFMGNVFQGYGAIADTESGEVIYGCFHRGAPVGKVRAVFDDASISFMMNADGTRSAKPCDFTDVQPLVDNGVCMCVYVCLCVCVCVYVCVCVCVCVCYHYHTPTRIHGRLHSTCRG